MCATILNNHLEQSVIVLFSFKQTIKILVKLMYINLYPKHDKCDPKNVQHFFRCDALRVLIFMK